VIARWRDEMGDPRALALVRVCLGVLLLRQAVLALRAYSSLGYFGDYFHLPMLPASLVPSRAVYLGVLGVTVVLSLAVIVGRRARDALLLSSVLGGWLMLCDRLQLHNNRWALLCFSFLLSFSPCDRDFVLGRRETRASSPNEPLWAQRLMQAQMAVIYLGSGGSKLLDADWRDGRVIADRLARFGHREAPPALHGLVDFLARPEVSALLGRATIITELFLAVGLFVPRTRIAALWLGVVFHLTIEITSKVEAFTWLTLAIYALFAVPDRRGRTLRYDGESARGISVARMVRALDWLARFAVVETERARMPAGASFSIVDRDGREFTGGRAIALIARCCPLLFVGWPVVALVTGSWARANGRTAPRRAR
jgi:hypothetical protein